MTLYKSVDVKVKAAGTDDGLDEGQFEAVVSVFGNRDSYGDIVIKGAFTDTLAAWAAKGDPIPVYWSHRMDDPDYNIGEVVDAKETDVGLQVTGQLDLDSPKAAQVYRLLKGRRVTQFSFAYDVVEGAMVEQKRDDGSTQYSFELRKLDLYEVGPCALGANQETELLGVKTVGRAADHLRAAIKAGRVLSAKNEDEIRSAHEALGRVLSVLDSTDDQEKASTSGTAKTEEPSGAKAEEPSRGVSVNDLAAIPFEGELIEIEGVSL